MKPFNSSQWTFHWSRDPESKVNIRYALHASAEKATTLIYILNGRSEWIEKYHELAEDLRFAADVGFVTLDHRGQGASEGQRGHIDQYDDYAEDLARVISETVKGRPYVVVAHSMGGLIALYAQVQQKIAAGKVVLCSPLLGLPDRPFPATVSKWIARSVVKLGAGKRHAFGGDFERPPFEENPLTHDPERYEQMRHNPYPIPAPTFRWVDQTFVAMERVFAEDALKVLRVPVLLLGGGDERVVEPLAFSRWTQAALAAGVVVQHERIPEARHELLAEMPRYRDKVLSVIAAFLSS